MLSNKLVTLVLIFLLPVFVYGMTPDSQKNVAESIKLNAKSRETLVEVYTRYKSGSYEGALNLIDKLEKEYQGQNKDKLLGLISYWRGVIYNRVQDFESSKNSFAMAFKYEYTPEDIYYEFAQSLYALNELKKSRDLFMRSALNNYRPAVSLYYVAFISQTLRDFRLAVKVYRRIERLKDPEKESVLQASRMQVADIYLTAVDKQEDQVAFLQKRVLSEFENALIFDPDSILSRDIRRKMLTVKDKYGLILLKMRNGRPTIFPRRFIKLTQEIGHDTNVTGQNAAGQENADAKGSTLYTRTDGYIRRVYYAGNSVSLAPELRANYTHYTNSATGIQDLVNYTYTPALRTAQEHWMWGKPASFLFDFEYNKTQLKGDSDADGNDDNSVSQTFMLGERFNYFSGGESIFRFRYKSLDSNKADSDNTTKTLSFEQVLNFEQGYLLLLSSSYGMLEFETGGMTNDTNTFSFSFNLITPRLFDYATPSIGIAYSKLSYPNSSTAVGSESTLTPSLKLTRVFNKTMRGNLGISYTKSDSSVDTFVYNKTVITSSVEFLF